MILATLGRYNVVDRFLLSMAKQTTKDFEVIIVDQNEGYFLEPLIEKYKKKFSIKHVKTNIKGLSKARNIGLKYIEGEIVCFPDDDCYYERDTVENVLQIFKEECLDGIISQVKSEDDKPLLPYKMHKDERLTTENIWNCAISFSIFLSREVIVNVGEFDEIIGVGANTIFGSGEETDYLYRALYNNAIVRFKEGVIVHHPKRPEVIERKDIERAFYYGCGCGYVLMKNNATIKIKLRFMIRPLIGAFIALLVFKDKLAMLRWNTFYGRIKGMFLYKQNRFF